MNLIVAWLGRRALELGGLAGMLLTVWSNLPPATQSAVLSLLTNKWQTVTLGTLAPLAVSLFGYAWSFLATTRSQVVVDGKKVAMSELPPSAKVQVKQAVAETPRKSILDIFRR